MGSKLIRCVCNLSKNNIMLYHLEWKLPFSSKFYFHFVFVNHQLFLLFCSSTAWHLLALNILSIVD